MSFSNVTMLQVGSGRLLSMIEKREGYLIAGGSYGQSETIQMVTSDAILP